MKRTLAISVLLLCLLKIPWQANSSPSPGRSNSASGAYQNVIPLSTQQISPIVMQSSPKAVKTPHVTPVHTPRPTALPPEIPPPTDRRLLHSMILFAVIASLTIVFGLWTNRQRINPR